MSSPKALISCVPQVFVLLSNIMLRAAWMSLSSEYPHSQLYTRSANVMSFFSFPHMGQSFVVGTDFGRIVTRSDFISLAFASPNTECCTVRPNSPLCIHAHALTAHALFCWLRHVFCWLISGMPSVTSSPLCTGCLNPQI